MSDNSTQGGSDTIRDIDKGGVKTQVFAIDKGGAGSESLVTDDNPYPVKDETSCSFLSRILQILLAPLGYDKSLTRYRGTVVVESGSLGSVTFAANQDIRTVAALTNQTNIGGFNADAVMRSQINTAWNLNVRSRIT